jgi:hypothetical protein
MLGTLAVVTMVSEAQDGQDCGSGPTSLSALVRFRVKSGYRTGPPRCALESWWPKCPQRSESRKKLSLYVERANRSSGAGKTALHHVFVPASLLPTPPAFVEFGLELARVS